MGLHFLSFRINFGISVLVLKDLGLKPCDGDMVLYLNRFQQSFTSMIAFTYKLTKVGHGGIQQLPVESLTGIGEPIAFVIA